jgi:hypothetical protein
MEAELKTTIDIPDEIWNRFATLSIEKTGRSGQRNKIINKLIQLYNDGKVKVAVE